MLRLKEAFVKEFVTGYRVEEEEHLKPSIDILYKHINNTGYFDGIISNETPTNYKRLIKMGYKFHYSHSLRMKLVAAMTPNFDTMIIKFMIKNETFYRAIGKFLVLTLY